MLRGSSGFYSYAIYEHLKDWPDFDIGETRITFKLRKDKYKSAINLSFCIRRPGISLIQELL